MARPLNKAVNGKLLVRSPQIEADIDFSLGQDLDTLKQRAAIRNKNSPKYLRSECLVHLTRNSLRQSNSEATHSSVANTLLPFLLKRCEANLKATVSPKIATAADLREEILSRFAVLFAAELAPNAESTLDFFEVRFNRAFRFFRIDAVRSELRRINHLDNLAPPLDDDGVLEGSFENALSDVPNTLANPDASPEDLVFKKQMKGKLLAAIKELPEGERKALILHHFYELKIESENPGETTVAALCKTSGRTIRTRLARAMARLATVREAT